MKVCVGKVDPGGRTGKKCGRPATTFFPARLWKGVTKERAEVAEIPEIVGVCGQCFAEGMLRYVKRFASTREDGWSSIFQEVTGLHAVAGEPEVVHGAAE